RRQRNIRSRIPFCAGDRHLRRINRHRTKRDCRAIPRPSPQHTTEEHTMTDLAATTDDGQQPVDAVTEGIAAESVGGDFAAMLAVPEPQQVYAGIGSTPILAIDGNHIVGAAKSVDTLTRSHHVLGSGALGNTQSADRPLIPLDIDRPEHPKYRKLLDPIFSAKAIAHL